MKTFTKWNIRTGIFIGAMLLLLFVKGEVKVGFLELIGVFLIGTVSLGTFMYLIEDKYFPVRRKKVLKKVVQIFNADPISDYQAKFKVNNYDILVDVDFVLSLNMSAPNGEVVSFHIPRDQLENRELSKPLSQIEELFNEIETFRIYQTNSMGLKLAKKRIEKNLSIHTGV